MPDIEQLLAKYLSNFGVDPTASGASPAVLPEANGPETESNRASPAEPKTVSWLSSPYACTPTTWGIEETPAPEAQTKAERPAAKLPPSPAAAAKHRRSSGTKPGERSRWRLRLTVHRAPPPRGLMSS